MITLALALAWFGFLFWRVKRAREKAAELAASGVLRTPLFWIGNLLMISVLALSMYMASLKPAEISREIWLTAISLFVATILVRIALKRRYFV